MKTVQDKDGNVIQVADNTPCHAGKNGALPVMLDATLDAGIFSDMAAREAAYDAEAPERALAKVIAARNKERGSVGEQMEFLIDNGLQALINRDNDIKVRNPKP